jgi:NitT/TauT family transport system substrate-binding protein
MNTVPSKSCPRAVILCLISFWTLCLSAGCDKQDTSAAPVSTVRIGYFGNVTHAQAVLGVASGEFADAVKPAIIEPKVFNAGPSLIEALLAGEVDIGYVGPGPALNAHQKTKGAGVRVIAGAAANGVLIVARKGSGIGTLQDLAGKRIATPQHGNTQDIAARHFMMYTLHQTDLGNVMPIPNAEQAAMMSRGQIDAAWAPEPWGSLLVSQTGAKVLSEEKDLWPNHEFILTLVITTPEFLSKHPDAVRSILKVHHQWTVRLQQEPQKYLPQLESALFAISGKKLPAGVVGDALGRVKFTDDPLESSIATMGAWAYELQFAPGPVNLASLIDTKLLEEAEKEGSGFGVQGSGKP